QSSEVSAQQGGSAISDILAGARVETAEGPRCSRSVISLVSASKAGQFKKALGNLEEAQNGDVLDNTSSCALNDAAIANGVADIIIGADKYIRAGTDRLVSDAIV